MKYKDIKYPFVLYKMNPLTRIVLANSSHGPRFVFEAITSDAMGDPYWQPVDPLSELAITLIHDLASRMVLQLQETEVEIPAWWNEAEPTDDAVDEIADEGVDILDALGPTIAPDAPDEPASIEPEAEG